MADFDPQAYVAQNTPEAPAADGTVTVTGASGFDPTAYVAQNNPPAQNTGGFKLGTVGDAAVSGERMLNAIAKPPAALAEYLGWSQPAKDLMARDEYLKQHSGLGASLSSFGFGSGFGSIFDICLDLFNLVCRGRVPKKSHSVNTKTSVKCLN